VLAQTFVVVMSAVLRPTIHMVDAATFASSENTRTQLPSVECPIPNSMLKKSALGLMWGI
jgi:hypothetical protein